VIGLTLKGEPDCGELGLGFEISVVGFLFCIVTEKLCLSVFLLAPGCENNRNFYNE